MSKPRAGFWQRWFKSLNNLHNQLFFHRIARLAATASHPIALAPINRATRACYQTLRQEVPDIDSKVHLYDADPERHPHYPGRSFSQLTEATYPLVVLFCDGDGAQAAQAFEHMADTRFLFSPRTFMPLTWIDDPEQRYGMRAYLHDLFATKGNLLTSAPQATATNLAYHVGGILMRLVRPLVHVRIWRLRCDRIGHFAANTDVHLATLAHQGTKRTLHFYTYPVGQPVANHALKTMWDRRLSILKFGALAIALNAHRPDQDRYFGSLATDRDPHGMLHHNGPFLQLSRAEHAEGRRLLHNLGIPEGAPFFIFHARDAGYLKTADPNTNYSYHRFRDVDINSYKVAINMLLARGYYAVRIGAVVERAMDLSHPNFVDYTQSPHRTPFGDIYLCAACAFMLASSSGIDSVARLFRRPLACTNVVPLGSMREKPLGLFIPKRTYSQPLKRFLTYDEIVNGPSTQYFRAEEYEADGLVCHENSPEEIRALAEELVQRVEGAWETKPEDEALQAQFWKLFSTPPENQNFCRIGADFLRNNPDLLGAPRPSEPPEPLQQHRKSHNDVNFS